MATIGTRKEEKGKTSASGGIVLASTIGLHERKGRTISTSSSSSSTPVHVPSPSPSPPVESGSSSSKVAEKLKPTPAHSPLPLRPTATLKPKEPLRVLSLRFWILVGAAHVFRAIANHVPVNTSDPTTRVDTLRLEWDLSLLELYCYLVFFAIVTTLMAYAECYRTQNAVEGSLVIGCSAAQQAIYIFWPDLSFCHLRAVANMGLALVVLIVVTRHAFLQCHCEPAEEDD